MAREFVTILTEAGKPAEKTKLRSHIMNSEKKSSLYVSGIVQAAVIAALYAALSFLTGFIPKVGGMFQFRVSEALTILPYFTVSAVPGLTIGCLVTNIILGGGPYDIILGTFATLLGAVGTRLLRKHKFLATLPPIIANTVIMPFAIALTAGTFESVPFFILSVGLEELVSCGVLGIVLLLALEKRNIFK